MTNFTAANCTRVAFVSRLRSTRFCRDRHPSAHPPLSSLALNRCTCMYDASYYIYTRRRPPPAGDRAMQSHALPPPFAKRDVAVAVALLELEVKSELVLFSTWFCAVRWHP